MVAGALVVQADGHGRYLIDFDSGMAEDGLIDLGVVELPEGRRIEGVAYDQRDSPLPWTEVTISGHNDDRGRLRPGKKLALDLDYGHRELRRTDDLGRFRFPDLSPGEYTLSLRVSGRPKIDRAVVLPPDRDLVDVELVAEIGTSITVMVIDRAGTPVALPIMMSPSVVRTSEALILIVRWSTTASMLPPVVVVFIQKVESSGREGFDAPVTSSTR